MKPQGSGWMGWLPTPWVVGIATLGPVGQLPAPGTWGSLAALPFVALLHAYLPDSFARAAVVLAGLCIAVAVCGEAEVRLGLRDPGRIILDEFTAMPLCFLGWSRMTGQWPVWAVLLAGFTAFRFFDIAKPLGIRWLQKLPGGWGVVADDVAAAAAACAALHGARLVAVYLTA